MDRDMIIKLSTAEQLINKEFVEELYLTDPFVCNLLLNTFKEFLTDSRFKPVERQLILLRFLKNNYPIELTREVIDYLKDSYFEKDYIRIILEWNYSSSEFIKQNVIGSIDTPQLAFNIKDKQLYDKQTKASNKKIEIIQQITNTLLDHLQDEVDDE